MASPIRRIIITTGDADGIGTEVTAKALNKISSSKNIQYVIIRSQHAPVSHIKLMSKKFKRIQFDSLSSALLSTEAKANILLDVVPNTDAHQWIYDAATACVRGQAAAITTAPMSKKSAGGRTIGHTEILKDVSKSSHVFMAFLGRHFNVVSCTGHIGIKDVSSQLTGEKIIRAAELACDFAKVLPREQRARPLGLVGLNPHAGENGSIGTEESTIYMSAQRELENRKISCRGPLVPDAAFIEENWSKYSFYISPYHDQGLIPFKLVHGKSSGAHITLGLPFIRTSVDHGTAKDIFNKNKANPGSMIDALKWAVQLVNAKTSKESK